MPHCGIHLACLGACLCCGNAPQCARTRGSGPSAWATPATRSCALPEGGFPMALGITGIVVSLALLIFLAYGGWNVILIAPLCALVGLAAPLGIESPLIATYTQVFMPALGQLPDPQVFPAVSARRGFRETHGRLRLAPGTIAHKIIKWIGKERADHRDHPRLRGAHLRRRLAVRGRFRRLSGRDLAVARGSNLPKRLIPATIALGSFTFTMSALPGSPAIQNAIPMPFSAPMLRGAGPRSHRVIICSPAGACG